MQFVKSYDRIKRSQIYTLIKIMQYENYKIVTIQICSRISNLKNVCFLCMMYVYLLLSCNTCILLSFLALLPIPENCVLYFYQISQNCTTGFHTSGSSTNYCLMT